MTEPFLLTTDGNIEPDDWNQGDGDSAYNDSIGSESYRTSITSSVVNYKYENGRRYHAYREGEYTLPNDEEEQDRLDLLHHIYGLILGGETHIAPIKNPQRVLDLGTGTGIWAIDFADQHSSAEVIGNDLSPIQSRWIPPNCQFEVDDFESEWPYNNSFDYIHGRELAGAIHDFSRLARQAFSHLRPGGFFEVQSFLVDIFSDDRSLDKAPYTKQGYALVQEASAKFGKPMNDLDKWPTIMREAGFIEVVCKIVKVPLTPWPKDPKQKQIGRYFQIQHMQGIPAYTNALLSRVLGWSKAEIDILNMHVLRELKDREVHQYEKLYLIYGRKP